MLESAKFKVVIPSYKRWDTIKRSIANRIADYMDVSVVALEEDKEKYKKVLNSKINFIGIDDTIEGRLPRKRNWILDNLFTPDLDFFVMMDDDIEGIYFMASKLNERIDEEAYKQLLLENYQLAKIVGAPAFGFSNSLNIKNKLRVRLAPITFHALFSEVCIGYLDRSFRHDERIYIREDVEMLCKMLYSKGVLVKNCLYGVNEVEIYGSGSGGLRNVGNRSYWDEDSKLLIKKYGLFVKNYFDRVKGIIY